jgi:hypothetical protein
MLIFSCHSDTGFSSHALNRRQDGELYGHLDNFAGVYVLMRAYFTGRLNQDYLRIELTYGEERDYAGAYEVLATLDHDDTVFVIDVTGVETKKDFTIEKCRNKKLQKFLLQVLDGMAFDIYEDCPDPIANEDEVDVYIEKCDKVCFLGIPCFGGDYNAGKVSCKENSLESAIEAICRIAENFSRVPDNILD